MFQRITEIAAMIGVFVLLSAVTLNILDTGMALALISIFGLVLGMLMLITGLGADGRRKLLERIRSVIPSRTPKTTNVPAPAATQPQQGNTSGDADSETSKDTTAPTSDTRSNLAGRLMTNHGGFKLILLSTTIGMLGYFLIAYLESGKDSEAWSWARTWAFAAVAYIIFSFRFDKTIGPDEIGVRLCFGYPTDQISSGLPFVPIGLFTLVKLSTLVQQLELPAPPSKIWRGEMSTPETMPPKGTVPPTRVTFTESISEEEAKDIFGEMYTIKVGVHSVTFNHKVPKDGLSQRRVTAEVVIIVRYRVQNGIDFIRTIGSFAAANQQIEDTSVALVTRIYTQMSLGQALQNLQWASRYLFHDIERVTGLTSGSASWGIDLENANMKALPLHHPLNKAIGSASEAEFEKLKTVTNAEAEHERLAHVGQGEGEAELAVLRNRTDGYKGMKDALGVDPTIVIGSETARAITENPGQKTIIAGASGGFKDLAAAAAIFGDTKSDSGRKPESDTDEPQPKSEE